MTNRSIIDCNAEEARNFFLTSESYFNNDLPVYFNFDLLLGELSKDKINCDFREARLCDGVNHVILSNKDGKFAWRPLQLIHPAIYVSLVTRITEEESWKEITESFKKCKCLENIECISIPKESLSEKSDKAEQILNWWERIEQRSLELALDWEYLMHTDIQNCYGEIYTHSIPWAIHGKKKSKENTKDSSLIGNIIDQRLQDFHRGQTNGIPQGSVLMDFFAEMVLGRCDRLLECTLKKNDIKDYYILRYRDDYRIFVQYSELGNEILKYLAEVLHENGLKLSVGKTKGSDKVIEASLKSDKICWFCKKNSEENLQKYLLLIHTHSLEFPNSGSVVRSLSEFYCELQNTTDEKLKPPYANPLILISITTDIAIRNPRTYPICSAIISVLLSKLADEKKSDVLKSIHQRFERIPNTGFMDIWLQRISLKAKVKFDYKEKLKFDYKEKLCGLAAANNIRNGQIWNCDWITSNDRLKRKVIDTPIFSKDKLDSLDPVIGKDEVELFKSGWFS